MTVTISALTAAEALRGDRLARPRADRTVAAGLRADLEDLLASVPSLDARTPRRVFSGDLRRRGAITSLPTSLAARLRGALVNELLELLVSGTTVDDPFTDAWATFAAGAPSGPLVDFGNELRGDDRAALATDVTAHWVTLSSALGEIRPTWLPRTGATAAVRLGGGRVVLHDVIDLAVGSPAAATASVALLDITTGGLSDGTDAVARYHALVECLRSTVAPLRVVTLSTLTGEVRGLEVTTDELRTALADVATVLAPQP